jgi:UDP-N-acetylglucosamine 2-epimerase
MSGNGRRVLAVFGTRPEAIKMLPVIGALRRRPGIEALACSTGQHREMLDQALAAFGAASDIELGLMRPGQGLGRLAARTVMAVTEVLERVRPDLVLVQGDTTTALAAGMAAHYAGIAVGHVEAGLRSFDHSRPWPEEFNRVAVDAMATLLFAPTEAAAANLRAEPNRRGRILVTGNPGIDALLASARRLECDAALRARVDARLPALPPARRMLLVTAHRRESLGEGFERICDGLLAIAARGDVDIVCPVHPNPEVHAVLGRRLGERAGIHLIPPVDHLAMVRLMSQAAVVLTDSGGMQEEAPALGRPVLVLRDVTERPEALATGVARLVGTDPASIATEAARLLDDPAAYRAVARPVFPYGDGTAAIRIADAIEEWDGT